MRLVQIVWPATLAEHQRNVRWAERLLATAIGTALIAGLLFFFGEAFGRVIPGVLFTIASMCIAGCFGLRIFAVRAHRGRIAIAGWLALAGALLSLLLAIAIPASLFLVAVKRPASIIADLVALLMVSLLFFSRGTGPTSGR